jgi:hypothetical protein
VSIEHQPEHVEESMQVAFTTLLKVAEHGFTFLISQEAS